MKSKIFTLKLKHGSALLDVNTITVTEIEKNLVEINAFRKLPSYYGLAVQIDNAVVILTKQKAKELGQFLIDLASKNP